MIIGEQILTYEEWQVIKTASGRNMAISMKPGWKKSATLPGLVSPYKIVLYLYLERSKSKIHYISMYLNTYKTGHT
jgi:hypothetical protein